MSVRGGQGPRDPIAPPAQTSSRRANPYQRTGRYGRGPGDQRRYERYGDQRGSFGGILRFLLFLFLLAAGVLIVLGTVARPVVRAVVVPWAWDNPSALQVGFVSDLVREDLGSALTAPASDDATTVEFVVESGDTPATLAPKLEAAGLVTSQRAFLYEARQDNLLPKLNAGRYSLARNLTPAGVVNGLVNNLIQTHVIPVTFREGLRAEQMAAKLETIGGTDVDPKAFYDLVMNPTDDLLGDYPWLLDESVRPKGASLEGFLYPATYSIKVGDDNPTTAEDLVRQMLDAFHERVGAQLDVPAKRGLTFYQVLTLASIVEREAQLDSERPLIAGVYQNRLNPKKWPTGLLQSDPTIFYVNDTLQLDALKFQQWQDYVFWDKLKDQLPAALPKALAGYNTYTSKGLPPGPISSPSIASIDAALAPNTKDGYLFFIAKGDGSGTSAFAKTHAEHEQNVAKYGKN
ncbi:MAG TPA: endolytic transglycosylase MltG [Candidatus Limnocylindrales bacterium]